VAREVGLLFPDSPIILGADLPRDQDELGALLDQDGVVVARLDPEDKLRVAAALRKRGHVVAMTGDGVNDGPALREADIGIAMGRSGTDVAREASDLVLLDDDFTTILAAIREGRATFRNIRHFLTYHLTDNVAELTPFLVWGLSGGTFPLAIGVMQVLCLDIGTDLLPALALGAEPPSSRELERPPDRSHLLNRRALVRAFGVLGPVEAAASMLTFLAGLLILGWSPGDPAPDDPVLFAASGGAFAAIVLGQMANALACRHDTLPAWRHLRTNRLMVVAVLSELLLLAAFLFVDPVADALSHAPPPKEAWLVALLAPAGVVLADWLFKRVAAGDREAPP
jgi:magnesium-transporting ATPase (P-type)